MTLHSHLDATTQTWHKSDEPRAFTLKFDQSKLKSANPMRREAYKVKQELLGVQFPNGACILDRSFMCYYSTLTELCDSFGTIGVYNITWHDEQEASE